MGYLMYRREIAAAVARTGNKWTSKRGRWRGPERNMSSWALWLADEADGVV
jgi:hypothetical protein